MNGGQVDSRTDGTTERRSPSFSSEAIRPTDRAANRPTLVLGWSGREGGREAADEWRRRRRGSRMDCPSLATIAGAPEAAIRAVAAPTDADRPTDRPRPTSAKNE